MAIAPKGDPQPVPRWRREIGHIRRSLVAIFRPVWRFHNVLGPLSYLVALGLAALIGFFASSIAWGVVALAGGVAALALAEVVRRERTPQGGAQAGQGTTQVTVMPGATYVAGNLILPPGGGASVAPIPRAHQDDEDADH